MLQLRVEGKYIDLYDTDPIKLNLSLESLQSFKPTSVFTRTFRVPSTANNYEFFQTAFEVNGYDFDITIKKDAVLLVNTDEYKQGHIRLNKIYNSDNGKRIDYEIVFFGEVRDLASVLNDGLCQLDLSHLHHMHSEDNIIDSWQAYPETPAGNNDGLKSGSVIYPLIDFGNTYDENGNIEQARISPQGTHNFTQGGSTSALKNLTRDRFKPLIKAKDLVDKILDNAGYTYESTFLNSNLFRHIYVSAFGNERININDLLLDTNTEYCGAVMSGGDIYKNAAFQSTFEYLTLPLDDTTSDPNFDDPYGFISSSYYVVPVDINATTDYILPAITIYFNLSVITDPTGILTFETVREEPDGTIHILDTNSWVVSGDAAYTNNFSFNGVNQGDKIYVRVKYKYCIFTIYEDYGSPTAFPSRHNYLLSGDVCKPELCLDCDYKQIDFLTDIISKFKLIIAPHPTIKSKLIIEPWKDWIASGEIKDWTKKLDTSKDVVIEPTFFEQDDIINFTESPDGDFLNTLNEEIFKEVYGALRFDSQNDLLKGEKKFETKFASTPIKQIEDASTAGNGMWNTIIPQIHTHTNTDTGLQHLPIKAKTRLLFYDGLESTGYEPANAKDWYMVVNGSSTNMGDEFPMVSPYSEWPIDTQTLDLNWQKETSYILQPDLVGFDIDAYMESVYDRYWINYVNDLYNKWGRKITAYFYLTSEDIRNFEFKDVIFVKDTYYYVSKIIDATFQENSLTKVELIKLLDFVVPSGGFIPIGTNWEDVATLWNNTTDNWEDV